MYDNDDGKKMLDFEGFSQKSEILIPLLFMQPITTKKIKRFRMNCGRKPAGSSLTLILMTKVSSDSS